MIFQNKLKATKTRPMHTTLEPTKSEYSVSHFYEKILFVSKKKSHPLPFLFQFIHGRTYLSRQFWAFTSI